MASNPGYLYVRTLVYGFDNQQLITATILPAIAFMIILYFGVQAVGRNPVALVCTG